MSQVNNGEVCGVSDQHGVRTPSFAAFPRATAS